MSSRTTALKFISGKKEKCWNRTQQNWSQNLLSSIGSIVGFVAINGGVHLFCVQNGNGHPSLLLLFGTVEQTNQPPDLGREKNYLNIFFFFGAAQHFVSHKLHKLFSMIANNFWLTDKKCPYNFVCIYTIQMFSWFAFPQLKSKIDMMIDG